MFIFTVQCFVCDRLEKADDCALQIYYLPRPGVHSGSGLGGRNTAQQ